MASSFTLAAGFAIAALLAAGCSSEASMPSRPTPTAVQATALGCDQQAAPATPASSALIVGDVSFDRLDKPLPQASAVALPVAGMAYYLYKAFMYVTGPLHSHTTIAVDTPSTASLYYTNPDTWGSQRSPAAILKSATKAVTVEACEGLTGYTGGFLVQSPTCMRIRVTSADQVTKLANLAFGVSGC